MPKSHSSKPCLPRHFGNSFRLYSRSRAKTRLRPAGMSFQDLIFCILGSSLLAGEGGFLRVSGYKGEKNCQSGGGRQGLDE